MQYLMIFLAVLAVVAFLFLFIFTAIRQIAIRIREQVRGRYIEELSMFDRIYKEKMDRLKVIREEQELLDSNIMKKAETLQKNGNPGMKRRQARQEIPRPSPAGMSRYPDFQVRISLRSTAM